MSSIWSFGTLKFRLRAASVIASLACVAIGLVGLFAIGRVTDALERTAFVLAEECCGCKSCLPLCPYTAITFDEAKEQATINEALCKGCGTCVAACPSGSIVQNLFDDEEIFSEIKGVLAYE